MTLPPSNNTLPTTDPIEPESVSNRVIVLGRWAQEGRWITNWSSSVPTKGTTMSQQLAQRFLADDAARITGLQPILLTQIPDWDDTWASLHLIEGLPRGEYSGLGSGVGVQQVFEGGIATAIYFDVTGIEVLGIGQTPGELRNVITTLQTEGNQNVDVYICENGKVSKIPRGSNQVFGAPLPERIAERLPNLKPLVVTKEMAD
jgi:hypothetical protein